MWKTNPRSMKEKQSWMKNARLVFRPFTRIKSCNTKHVTTFRHKPSFFIHKWDPEIVFTARIRRMGEGTVFSLFVSPHLDGGEGDTPGLDGGGYPRSGWSGGTQGNPPTMRQNSRASTCYPAGGMPLAFTQEDFLVFNCVHSAMKVQVCLF